MGRTAPEAMPAVADSGGRRVQRPRAWEYDEFMVEDLTSLKEDMIAFIEGHGMRRFSGYVHSDEIASVLWDSGDNADGWKDFVELAKGAGATFLTMNAFRLSREDVDWLVDSFRNSHFSDDEEVDEAKWLRAYVDRTGFVQLGWAHQGVVFLYEVSTEWYDRYQRLLETAEEFGGIALDETDQDDSSSF